MATTLSPEADRLLDTFRRTIIGLIHRENADLTMRQLAVLLICYRDNEPQTVRGLAEKLALHRPGVTRSLDRLEDASLIRREIDPHDRRSVFTARTAAGQGFLHGLQQTMAAAAEAAEQSAAEQSGEPAPRGALGTRGDGIVRKIQRSHPNLTSRQRAVLLTCYSENGQQTVRGLAAKLNLPKGTISRILDRLEGFGLARRQPDPSNGRSVLIARTGAGGVFFRNLQGSMAQGQASALSSSHPDTPNR